MKIMLTNHCNLLCDYCISKEGKNKRLKNIGEKRFRSYLDLLQRNHNERVSLIGGEPTLHPQFKQFIDIIKEYQFPSVEVYSNGLFNEDIQKKLMNANIKTTVIINLNPPDKVGSDQYGVIQQNIQKLLNANVDVVLEINIFDPNMTTDYFKALLKETHIKRFRWSVLNFSKKTSNETTINANYKAILMDLLQWAKQNNIATTCIYNQIPLSSWNDEELLQLLSYDRSILSAGSANPIVDVSTSQKIVCCSPTSEIHILN